MGNQVARRVKNELNAKKRGFAFMGKPLEKAKFLPLIEEYLSKSDLKVLEPH